MNLKTPNTFVRCSCGSDVAIRFINEVRICTCGKKIEFSEKMKKYLISRYVKRKKDSEIDIEDFIVKPIQHINLE